MNTTKKQIISAAVRVITFLCLFLVLFAALSGVFRSKLLTEYSYSNIENFYKLPENSLDVIYVGGSCCATFWMPLEAWNDRGFTSYSLSVDSINCGMEKHIIIEALKTQTPQLFVVDLRAFQLYSPDSTLYARTGLMSFHYSKNRYEMIKEVLPPDMQTEFQIDFLTLHSRWYDVFPDALFHAAPRMSEVERLALGAGFLFVNTVNPITYVDMIGYSETRELEAVSERRLTELLDFCKEKDLNVLFVSAPFCDDSKDVKGLYNSISEKVESYGYEFFYGNNYYDEMGLDCNTDFYNANHTNPHGARIYTSFLSAYLIDRFGVHPAHSDEVEQEWLSAYPIWSNLLSDSNDVFDKQVDAIALKKAQSAAEE